MLGSLAWGTSAGFTSCAAKTTFDSGYNVPLISWARFACKGQIHLESIEIKVPERFARSARAAKLLRDFWIRGPAGPNRLGIVQAARFRSLAVHSRER